MQRLDRLGWAAWVRMRVGGFAFGVRSTSPEALSWLVDALGDAVDVERAADPDDEYFFSLALGSTSNGRHGSRAVGRRIHKLYRGSWDVVASTDPVAVGRAFLAELDALTLDERADHPYLDAALARVGERHVLLPAMLAPALAPVLRRVRRRGVDVALPVAHSIAVLADGRVAPPEPLRPVDDAAWAEFPGAGGHGEGERYVLERPVALDAAVRLWNGAAGLHDASRAETLVSFATAARNLRVAEGGGVAPLSRLFADVSCLSYGWGSPEHLLSSLPGVVRPRHAA